MLCSGKRACRSPNSHKERQGEGHRDEEVYRGYFARLEDILAEDAMNVSARTCQGWMDNVQGRYVREEDADDQRTDRCGYCGAVHTPRRRLLNDARPARARRK